ncbi:MAG: hypothetical protein ACYC6V_04230 [Bacillota bacterium]
MEWPTEPYPLPGDRAAALMGSLALAWDGQWFLKTVEEFGLEAAMRLNGRVRVSFGKIEMRETLRALGKKSADDLADALRIIMTYSRIMLSGRLDATVEPRPDGSGVDITVQRCFVAENARRANLERFDQACLSCPELWRTWVAVLLPEADVSVESPAQLGRGDGRCELGITVKPAGAEAGAPKS